jgi:ribosomal protein L32
VIKQGNKPCKKCGSWYINEMICNKCGEPIYVPDSFYYNKTELLIREGIYGEQYGTRKSAKQSGDRKGTGPVCNCSSAPQ